MPQGERHEFYRKEDDILQKILINHDIPDEILKGQKILLSGEDALARTADFWDESRHDSLAERELKIYHMVDTIKTLPAFKTYVDLITLFFTGYKDIGLIELGPYYTLYSYNPIEEPLPGGLTYQ
ncbi:MAG: hypothetical protein IPP46_19295 [Bacteroidetes bacterium]|nr:hypothetical protein [Bacteroidota bacterium]